MPISSSTDAPVLVPSPPLQKKVYTNGTGVVKRAVRTSTAATATESLPVSPSKKPSSGSSSAYSSKPTSASSSSTPPSASPTESSSSSSSSSSTPPTIHVHNHSHPHSKSCRKISSTPSSACVQTDAAEVVRAVEPEETMAIGDEPLVDASQAPADSCPVERCTSALIGMFMDRLRCYLKSLRIASFTTSLIPVLMGALLAYKTTGQFNLITLCATITTVLSVHAAGNLVNTYCDFVRGIDSKRLSDDRTLVDKILKPEQVVNLGVLFYIIGCIGFLVVVLHSPARLELLALMYFGGISSSFLYTGGIGLKYIALGDIAIMLTFGPVSVLYSFIAQTGTIRLVTLLYAIPLALNAEAILHSNNTRDIEEDRRAGCVTLAVLIGPFASHILFAMLLLFPYLMFVFISIRYTPWMLITLITLPTAFKLEKQFRLQKSVRKHMPQRVAHLTAWSGFFYLAAVICAQPQSLPGLHHHF